MEIGSEGASVWRFTGMYGEPNSARRARTWDILRYLDRDTNLPWMVIEDLNDVTSQDDKRGGARYPNSLVEGYRGISKCMSY